MKIHRVFAFLLALYSTAVNRSFAQSESINDTSQYGVVGFSQHGSSGVFLLPSPVVLGTGQIGGCLTSNVGLSWMNDRTSFPFAFAFGVAKRVEAYASFFSQYSRGENEEAHSLFGLKMNFYDGNNGTRLLSTAIEVQRLEISQDTSGAQRLSAFSGKVICSSYISKEIIGYLNLGYTWVEDNNHGIKSKIGAGMGIVFPFNEYALAGAEIFTSERYVGSSGVAGRFGVKGFLLQHLQLALGAEVSHMDNGLSKGIFLGISFSSGQLSVGIGPRSKSPVLLPEPPPLEDIPARDSSSSGFLLSPESKILLISLRDVRVVTEEIFLDIERDDL